MEKKETRIPLPKMNLDDLFSTQEERDSANLEKVIEVKLTDITDFPNHPFKVKDDDEMDKMRQSVEQYGVVHPILVRPTKDGKYEMISGHRRKRASELANKDTIPCIVRNLSDDEATIIMVDSNMQREEILPRESRAFPTLKLTRNRKLEHIRDFRKGDFELDDYHPYDAIKNIPVGI